MLDTGVESAHEDLSGGVVPGFDSIDPHNGSNFGTIDLGSASHGTHVAGIAGARDNTKGGIGGVAGRDDHVDPGPQLGGQRLVRRVINGINHAVGSGADVISMSLGGTTYSPRLSSRSRTRPPTASWSWRPPATTARAPRDYPAALPGAIAVAATQQSSPDTLASFSQRGSRVDIAAPGSGIFSTVNGAYRDRERGRRWPLRSCRLRPC